MRQPDLLGEAVCLGWLSEKAERYLYIGMQESKHEPQTVETLALEQQGWGSQSAGMSPGGRRCHHDGGLDR